MKIAVLCGGVSNERDVSVSTGTGAARALREKGHQVVLMDLFLGYDRPFADPAEVFAARQDFRAFFEDEFFAIKRIDDGNGGAAFDVAGEADRGIDA